MYRIEDKINMHITTDKVTYINIFEYIFSEKNGCFFIKYSSLPMINYISNHDEVYFDCNVLLYICQLYDSSYQVICLKRILMFNILIPHNSLF
jgi:hypothetical protein